MKPIVCLDVDATLARYDRWMGIDFIGEPIPGAVEFTKQLSEFARVVIFTTRTKEYPVGKEAPPGAVDPDRRPASELVAVVKNWLDKHGFAYDSIYAEQGKPYFHAVVDDRAVSCRPQDMDPRWAYHQALNKARELCKEVKPSDVSPTLLSQLKGKPSA